VPPHLLIDVKEVSRFAPHEVAILSTGSQGESRSAMALMAADKHSILKIETGDTVVISARQIPGNERAIGEIINNLLRRGAHVIHENNANVHVSGHGAYEDLKLMLNLIQPRCFIPLHGEYAHLVQHAELAESTGVSKKNIIVAENGDRVCLTPEGCYLDGQVSSGPIFIDGKIEFKTDIVLHDRRQLAGEGIVVPVIVLNNKGQLATDLDLVTRGFVHIDASEELLNEAKQIITNLIEVLNLEVKNNTEKLQEEIRIVLRRFLKGQTGQIPIILPSISRLGATDAGIETR
jgi:ribonuclease J